MFSPPIALRYLTAMLSVLAITSRGAAEETAAKSVAELRAAYAQLDADYRRELDHLSHLAFAQNWSKLGEAAQGWRPASPESGALVYVAPDQYSADAAQAPRVDSGDSADAQSWLDQFDKLRRQQADELFQLASDAAQAGQLSLAFQWATEAVRENPDHAEARRVLGYSERGGKWLTEYGIRMADSGKTWHQKFGWIATADSARYDRGERLLNGRWTSAEDDAARRRDIKNGWQVRTDHFLVTTNHSLEAAAELAARLERLHQVWRQLFAGFHLTEREVQQLFAGKRSARTQSRPFRVFYHRDRDEYRAALRRRQPRIAETLGIYFDVNREAHFFAGDVATAGPAVAGSTGGPHVATLYHEAVHQLFQESKPAAKQIGALSNFWVIEGVATYFETLTEHADPVAGLYFTVGESTAGRLPAARGRSRDGFYVPLAELIRFGKNDIQRHPEIAKLYSQSAGLTAFLMDGQQGRYREPLVRYLAAVYAGRDNNQSLTGATGISYHDLDAQYRRSIESLP